MHKEIEFAKEVRKKNDYISVGYGISFVLYIIWMFCFNLFLDYELKDFLDRIGWLLLLAGMIMLVAIFSNQYYNSFFTLMGKKGEIAQNIFTVMNFVPFSLKNYQKYVKEQMVFWQWCLFIVTFLVNSCGLVISCYQNRFPVYIWQRRVSVFYIVSRLLGIALFSYLMAMIPQMVLTLKTGFMEKETKRAKLLHTGKKSQKTAKKMQTRKERFRIAIQCLSVLFVAMLYLILMDALHPMEEGQIVYFNFKLYNLYCILCASVLAEISHCFIGFQEKSEKSAKSRVISIVMKGMFGIALFMLPQGWYDAYYEDRIEVTRVFSEKTYDWKDVDSYEVYHPVLGNTLQLKLTMKDQNSYKVLNGMAGNTRTSEKYNEVYTSDIDYVEAIIEKLDALGVEGTLQDVEKIEKKIRKQEENEQKAWETIKKRME